MKKIRIAAIQMCSTKNRDENLAKAETLMQQAIQGGAELLALPENFSFVGHEREKLRMVEDLDAGPSIELLRSFSAQHGVAIIGGSVPMPAQANEKVTNSCLVFDPSGTLVGRYDKLHLFDVRIDSENAYEESRFVAAGDRTVTVTLFGHVMGLSICYDLRFPELYRGLALRGAQILFVPAAFTRETGRDHWEVLLRARAIENLCYVVAPAQCGQHSSRRASYGRTMIVGPWGQVMVQSQDCDGVAMSEVDFDFLEEARRRLPSLDHIRRELLLPQVARDRE